MQLINIKLAGFKSFVDPTTVLLPSNMIAVVGPNGCGKSNVIDAVRWVMGESSAKHLRGESITDVIFNGSSARQPVGQASVELNFDNADGAIGGEYAKYAEISVKRQVTRDGQSNYFLNNVRCRRRDITDIFLGTGLGPRSYSIIEQGTISRLVEAKPDELRVYLEEAAGISKYKERRRETELRIQHTRDNLSRLNDLREELTKQLEHLQRQASAAERYKVLKQEERLLKAQLQVLRWQVLRNQLQEYDREIKEQEVQLEAFIAEQRNADAELEQWRSQQIELNDAFNEVQSRYYRLGAEIARLEQALQHHRERRNQLESDIAQAEKSWQEAQQHLEDDQLLVAELNTQMINLEPEAQRATAVAEQSKLALTEAEQSLNDWQSQWDDFNRQTAEATQRAEVEQTRIRHLEQHLQTAQQRLERLEEEKNKLNFTEFADQITLFEQRIAELQQRAESQQVVINELIAQINTQRQSNQQHNSDLDKARSNLQTLRGRYASLEALQQAALGQRSGAVLEWLKQHDLAQQPRLAQTLQVMEGWDKAVETVLGLHLEAVCVAGMSPIAAMFNNFPQGVLTIFDTHAQATNFSSEKNTSLPTLLSKVKAPWKLNGLMSGIYVAESLPDALKQINHLASHESIITPEGIWLGAGWLRVARDKDEKAGILQRERELKELLEAIDVASAAIAAAQNILQEGVEKLHEFEAQRESYQRELAEIIASRADVDAQLRIQRTRVEHSQHRLTQVTTEISEVNSQLAHDQEQLRLARDIWQQAMQAMDLLADKREELTAVRDTRREQVETLRQQLRMHQESAHQLALRLQSITTQLSATQQNRSRMEKQLENFQERYAMLQQAQTENAAPLTELAKELEGILAKRSLVENELTMVRQEVTQLDHQLHQLEKKRQSAEQSALNLRNQLEHKRIEWQGLQVRSQTILEQIAESGYELEKLCAELTETADEAIWEEQLQRTTQRVERLGAINLAAIDEYATQAERKTYLDTQNDDLVEALSTLEDAIRKIDRETRAKFKATFDQVNTSFQALFPRIFGGGNAYLELTGEDLLDTGVTIMARPPGKRNSTIHLLSGGEKALTAVALVFAIFQLNPAPFCMLDEVDAPLDDANIGRFCDLVKEMSQRTQFVFISHNKLAMEMAQHLIGVTMHEPGVSRLVAVDVEEAISLAAA